MKTLQVRGHRSSSRRRVIATITTLAMVACIATSLTWKQRAIAVQTNHNHHAFQMAVGWEGWRPTEDPTKAELHTHAREDYEDFRRIREAGFDTIRTWTALDREQLELTSSLGLHVLQGMWTDPQMAFEDDHACEVAGDAAASTIRASRYMGVVRSYLVLNEPSYLAVLRAGPDATRRCLRTIARIARSASAGVPVAFSNLPGLELLDEESSFDEVAYNIYVDRPRRLFEELGVEGYLAAIRRQLGRGRSLVVTEYGQSVSPRADHQGRGGMTPEEQANRLTRTAREITAAGVDGMGVFELYDAWYKTGGANDAADHDPADSEEWYGLIEFKSDKDRVGSPRPALGALTDLSQALLVAPASGGIEDPTIPVRIHARDGVTSAWVQIDGSTTRTRLPVTLNAEGELETSLATSGAITKALSDGRHRLSFEIEPKAGQARTIVRDVFVGAPCTLSFDTSHIRLAPNETLDLAIHRSSQCIGDEAPKELHALLFDVHGIATPLPVTTTTTNGTNGTSLRVALPAFDREALVTLAVYDADPQRPSALRAAALAEVLVRNAVGKTVE